MVNKHTNQLNLISNQVNTHENFYSKIATELAKMKTLAIPNDVTI